MVHPGLFLDKLCGNVKKLLAETFDTLLQLVERYTGSSRKTAAIPKPIEGLPEDVAECAVSGDFQWLTPKQALKQPGGSTVRADVPTLIPDY